jgi:acyl-CoA synthetase (AMP-forming)/AMP-acid ligase II
MSSTFNIADLFEMVVDQNLDNEQPALICGDYRATYSQLEERSNQVAHFLKAKGIKAGDHVGLYMYNCGEYLEAMLGCFKIRAVPINVNYRYTGDELSYIFENSDMAACIHGQEFIPAIEQVKDKTPKLKLFVSLDDASGEDLARIGAVN